LDSDCVAQPHDSHHHHIHHMHTHGTSALPTATGRLLRQRHRCVLDVTTSRASSAPSSGGVVYGGRRSRRHHCDMSPSMVDTPPSSDLPFYGVVKNIIESQVPNLYSANQPQRGRMMSAFDRCSHGCCDGSWSLVPYTTHARKRTLQSYVEQTSEQRRAVFSKAYECASLIRQPTAGRPSVLLP
jgi:hypothetical protein